MTVHRRPIVLSPAGAAFLCAWEGFVGHCYDDSEGHCTIGIGHLIHYGPTTNADRLHWGTITRAHALALAQADAHHEGIVPIEQNIKVRLTQAQVDALICLCFNTGPGALGPTNAVTLAVNSKPAKWDGIEIRAWHKRVHDALMLWAHPSELTRRRQSEAALFSTGEYTKATGNTFANS